LHSSAQTKRKFVLANVLTIHRTFQRIIAGNQLAAYATNDVALDLATKCATKLRIMRGIERNTGRRIWVGVKVRTKRSK